MSIIDRITDTLLADAVDGMVKVDQALRDNPDARVSDVGLTDNERHAIHALSLPVRMGGCLHCGTVPGPEAAR